MDERSKEEYRPFLERRRRELVDRIGQAARRVSREPSDIQLVAVSKTVGNDEVALAHEVGYSTFAENRPQELKRKVAAARLNPALADVRFHMIGNLQTNKINQVLGNATLVHSLSSAHLAQALSRRSLLQDVVTPCLMEVNMLGEETKKGFSPDEAREVLEVIMGLDGISLKGLMTMAPARNPSAARKAFCGLRELRDELRERSGLELEELSCGMSGDFEIAVEEGSTLVRLGRIVFDPTYEDV